MNKKNKLKINFEQISRKLISIFFLFLFIGSIFTFNIDASRIEESLENSNTNSKCNTFIAKEGISELSYVFNRGDGCYTVELPKTSVQKIWTDILVKGFKIDQVSSDQAANPQRSTLEKNEVLVTQPGAQAGDLAIKKEMPNKMINTLEVPTLINQSCTGSFQYGLNLDSTLRIGRCTDPNQACYTNGDGLFRQNGQTGFFKEMKTVFKDVLDGIGLNKAKEAAGELVTGNDYSTSVELGVFSEMSSMELDELRKGMELADTNQIKLDSMKVLLDKAISNSFEAGNFAADMQTTCRGENCYINSYSLFDKMFNQYFSVDMVLSSVSPLILNGAAKILKNPNVKKVYDYIPNTLKKTKIVKEGGFWYEIISEPANLLRNPRETLSKAWSVKNAGVKRMEFIGDSWNSPGALSGFSGKDVRLRDAQNNGFQTQMNDLLKTSTERAGPFQSFLTKEYVNENTLKNLSKAGKRGVYNQTAQYATKMDEIHKVISTLKKDPDFDFAYKKLASLKAQGKSTKKIYEELTSDQIRKLSEVATATSKAQKIIKDQTFSNIDVGAKLKTKDLVTNRTKKITYLQNKNPVELELNTNAFKYKDQVKTLDDKDLYDKVYELNLKDDAIVPSVKIYDNSVVEDVTYKTADGINITIKKPIPYSLTPNLNSGTTLGNMDHVTAFKTKNPNGFIQYTDTASGTKELIPVSSFDEKELTGKVSQITGFTSTTKSLKDITDIDKTFDYMSYSVDPLDSVYDIMETVPKSIENTGKNLNSALTTFQNKNLADVKSINFISERMASVANQSYPLNFLTKSAVTFGWNFLYWEMKSGFNTFGLDSKGMSMYRLPDTYTAISIKHGETPSIYKDAYLDYFANDGSDQGDLFMAFLDSWIFAGPKLAREVLDQLPGGVFDSLSETINDKIRGKIKRNEVDDIVLFTDTINTGCGTSCLVNLSSEKYIEKLTKEKTLEGVSEEELPSFLEKNIIDPYIIEPTKEEIINKNIEDKYLQMDDSVEKLRKNLEKMGTDPEDIEKTIDYYKTQYLKGIENAKPVIKNKIDDHISGVSDDISISFTVPTGILVNNYVLENTSKDNLEEVGQNLITFAHHTDFEGTTANGTNEDAINLVKARNEGNTCDQKIHNLKLAGMPIGYVLPESHKAAGLLVLQEHITYLALPGYKNTWALPALLSSVPQQTLIMPQLHNCVDDKEGRYSHFFVSVLEDERIEGDAKNKVGDMVSKGVEQVEKSLSNISNGTDFEKTVTAGTNQAKEFINDNLKDYPIVQSRFSTSGSTNAKVNGQLFFIELGPNTSCRAGALSDNGVEILEDKNLKESLKIDKESGEMSIIDEKGNVNKIIDSENSDFVRLSGTNLGIPAKVIPHSLSYIPISDTNSELFEMDVYGNLIVLDDDFLSCLQSGYEAQTGLVNEFSSNNLVDYLGPVKNVNILNSLTTYEVYPQNSKIVAEGTPRQVANNKLAKLKINNSRRSKLSGVTGKEDMTLGKNISIQFEKGQLVYSGEKNAYIMWVEHTTITNNQDIKSLSTELVKEKAENGCEEEEIALNFKVKSVNTDKSSQAYDNTEKLNKAFENVGPFKMFDTATKTFIFYVSDPPECEQRMKIIDKETGEVYDQKITDIQETPNGIKIKTEDGTSHELEFSAENGIPELKYNGESETLLSAQGNNGSFWYDPQTGNWYTENGHLIPFNSDFKDGLMFSSDENGKVVGTPAQNVFNIGDNSGTGQGNGFNIPLSPSSFITFILYIFTILGGFILINQKINIFKKNKKKK